ncbi:conjugal transfer protein [Eikenella sp. S3360]|uniref:Conjugal transfer protein n=1 Tax=Eikenella glucosivorans TaxID=2766967 RepID=A0ABS0NB85_9NEIS|nr:conjugal transfer protein [Eikenella glucosivorans]MBH5329579.1 conjugal transfer protein [Eikenella glucosivorans]
MNFRLLPDPRPYPAEPVKNELLLHAEALAAGRSRAQSTLSRDTLYSLIFQMLQTRHLTSLSVALSMAPSDATYRALWQAMEQVLQPKTAEECGWIALPVVLVAGCNQAVSLPASLDTAALNAKLAGFETTRHLMHTMWLPALFTAEQISQVKLEQWFAAKQSRTAAKAFAAAHAGAAEIAIPAGQSVHVVYALGYGAPEASGKLGQAALPLMQYWQERLAALPLMQYWQERLAAPGLTLFANPLDPAAPLSAIVSGSQMRQRMALDVFAANAIRAVRLQSPRVGVAVAALEGGQIAFSFSAADSSYGLVPQIFRWQLSPADTVDGVVQNFLDLMAECRVEHIRLLHDVLPESAPVPDYAQALAMSSFNPLFSPLPQ